jgi:hypothetical protein
LDAGLDLRMQPEQRIPPQTTLEFASCLTNGDGALKTWLCCKKCGDLVKSVRRASTGCGVSAAKKRESIEQAGKCSRPKSAMKA